MRVFKRNRKHVVIVLYKTFKRHLDQAGRGSSPVRENKVWVGIIQQIGDRK